ncbi:MAG: peptidoglycan-associated lipoprotein Pal [Burkholderiales bacterium]|nr:peptidoglycan-associated lipoprotein Pal [Burkholderiales bacterium]
MRRALLGLMAAALVAGCASTGTEEGSGVAVEDRKPGAGGAAGSATSVPIGTTTIPGDPLKDPASPLAKRSVYFDFDRDDIKPEFRPMLEAHARYLSSTPNQKMLIQGNADERGSREYNLALGQRRADAVKRTLVLMGAREAQIEPVSLGEEKPRCTEQTEDCWAQNRRGDLFYSGEF